MAKNEDTPFVIDFKQQKHNNYGSAKKSYDVTSNSGSDNANLIGARATPTSQVYCLHGRSNVEVRDHCHRGRSEGVDISARRKLIFASILCLVFMICEIIGGVLSNSLSIATDAAHLLTDFASFMISLFAIWIAGRPSTQRMSFGWYRAEVIGAMASVFMIWVITGILVWLAIERLIKGDYEIDAKIMLITSGFAILVNLIMGAQLQHGHTHGGGGSASGSGGGEGAAEHQHNHATKDAVLSISPQSKTHHGDTIATCPASPTQRLENGISMDAITVGHHDTTNTTFSYQNSKSLDTSDDIETRRKEAINMNVRAAFIHVIGDMIQSVGVFIAALIIYFKPEWAVVDPICTFVFSIIVLFTTFNILKDALLVLMEGTPSYMHYTEVLQTILRIEGVERVHNLRIWALSINKVALSAHLAIAPGADAKAILAEATTAVHLRYNFFETTLQIEDYTTQMENCIQCYVPEK